MKKLFQKLNHKSGNLLFFLTLFLIVFIPLYPKLPLLDISNTWVYVRAEDFVVVLTLFIFAIFLFAKKVTLKTPLTMPILAFWIVGGLATLHGILLIFPTIANVFPNVAFLAYLRHIEYLSLFFVAYASIRGKRDLYYVFAAVATAFAGVVFYGFGQKYLDFPAFLTMNEEFAKGVPIHLSELSRLPSTFAGHYDLAAYLVLVTPILVSVIFGVRNILLKIVLALLAFGGCIIMILTVSRVSFVALLISLFIVLLFQKRKLVLFSIPVIIVLGVLFITFNSNLLARYTNTVSVADVLVNAKTGEAVGNIEYVPVEYFKDKQIKLQRIEDTEELVDATQGEFEEDKVATSAPILPIDLLKPGTLVPLVKASNISTGETLPQGTGYINLSLSPVKNRVGDFYYELSPNVVAQKGDAFDVVNFHGNFIIKKASAYDLSFTTRFQGEWPNALLAFSRNVLLGSGYGSISLAIDNNYLRMLGEIGLLGIASFFAIFVVIGVYIKRTWNAIDSKFTKSFIVGYIAGLIGLALNATLIDVFEASKVAFVLWLLTGTVVGTVHSYERSPMNVYSALKKAALSTPAFIVYIALVTIVVFLPLISNFFVADDFTWFRWTVSCGDSCNNFSRILQYFTSADGFFFRPGTKAYFAFMFDLFWLNQTVYHMVSIVLHFLIVVLFFILSLKILKNKLLAGVITILFLLMSGYSEIVFWISGTGHLFNALFILLALYLFVQWREKRKNIYYILSLASSIFALSFHELGVVIPFLIISYAVFFEGVKVKNILKNFSLLLYFVPVGLYLVLRFFAKSHWFNGDYSYDIAKLPFNVVGNAIGYVMVTFLGPVAIPLYEMLRNVTRQHIAASLIGLLILLFILFMLTKYIMKILDPKEKRIVLFGFTFFIILLLPFLGFGNITQRYSYLASLGLLLILAVFIKKLYQALFIYGKDIAVSVMVVVLFVFSLFHIIQVQKQHGDWRGAGDMVENFFNSVDAEYDNAWSTEDVELHFVNVPIRFGDAWVFPVGLEDALFLSFRNDGLRVFKHATVDEADEAIGKGKFNKIFEFQSDGSIKEVRSTQIDNTSPIH